MPALQITKPLTGEQNEILSPEAQAFLLELHQKFNARRLELLAARVARNAELRAGKLPDFLASTREIRESKWQVAPIPPALRDRRVSRS